MIPASFVPMIAKMVLGKKILPKLQEEIATHMAKMFKLEQLLNYMELPNDADKKVDKALDQITLLAGELSAMDNRLNKLEILNKKPKKVKSDAK